MYKVRKNCGMLADFHCHTIASVHAYSTIGENIAAAKEKGLKFLAITDHGSGCPDSPPLSYFDNLSSLPESVDGIRLLKGVEANIMDYDGNLDMPDDLLKKMDIVIASFHTNCITPGTNEQHTNAYLKLRDHPYVKIIGHAGTEEFSFDYEKVVPLLGEAGKIFEINAHTFVCRKDSIDNCIRIARLCKKYHLPVVVNSDAHSQFEVATCAKAFEMLREIDFPEELIINVNQERIIHCLESWNVFSHGSEQSMR